MKDVSIRRCSPASPDDERRDRHLRLPAERLRIRGHRARGRARRPHRHRCHQYLRGDQRSRGAGAAVDPPARSASGPARASSSPAARRRRSRVFAGMAEVDLVRRQRREVRGEAWRDARGVRCRASSASPQRKDRVADIMSVREMAPHLLDGFEGPAAGLRRGAERLRSPLHLLHHPLSAAAIRARCRWARWSTQVRALVERGHAEIVLTGVDLTSYGADLPGAPSSATGRSRSCSMCRSCRGCGFVDRLHRGRSRPARRHRRGRTADAASASVAAGRRRHDPEAHEAAARRADASRSARRCGACGPTWRSAPISSRAFRPRPKRCLSTRSTGRGMRPHLPACLSLSPRPGTPAARMPQVKGERSRRGRSACARAGEAALQKRLASEIGATRQVLIESAKQGRTEHFVPVAIVGETPGAVRALTIAGHDGARLTLRRLHRPV